MVFEDGVCMVRTAVSGLNGPPAYFGRNAQINFGTQNYSGDNNNRNFGGQLQDFRIYKGVAKYTASSVGEQALFLHQPTQTFSQTFHQVLLPKHN